MSTLKNVKLRKINFQYIQFSVCDFILSTTGKEGALIKSPLWIYFRRQIQKVEEFQKFQQFFNTFSYSFIILFRKRSHCVLSASRIGLRAFGPQLKINIPHITIPNLCKKECRQWEGFINTSHVKGGYLMDCLSK